MNARQNLKELFARKILNQRCLRCAYCKKAMSFPHGVNIFGTDEEKAFGIAIRESGIGLIEGHYPKRDTDKSGMTIGQDDRVDAFDFHMICKQCLKQILTNLAAYKPAVQANWINFFIAILSLGLAILALVR